MVDEHHRRALVERREQFVLTLLAQVRAGIVGQQHHTVGLERVERPDSLRRGFADVGHRHRGEEPEPVGCRRDQVCVVVVHISCERGCVGHGRHERGRRR